MECNAIFRRGSQRARFDRTGKIIFIDSSWLSIDVVAGISHRDPVRSKRGLSLLHRTRRLSRASTRRRYEAVLVWIGWSILSLDPHGRGTDRDERLNEEILEEEKKKVVETFVRESRTSAETSASRRRAEDAGELTSVGIDVLRRRAGGVEELDAEGEAQSRRWGGKVIGSARKGNRTADASGKARDAGSRS